MSGMRTVLTSTAVVTCVGIGFGMWSLMSPGEERKRELLKVIHHRHEPLLATGLYVVTKPRLSKSLPHRGCPEKPKMNASQRG
uniref:Uncharacterized protein n=1 Tax=Nothobranchius furzeri TaxID=105023 RepID=A0A8C6LEF5_NOTFU